MPGGLLLQGRLTCGGFLEVLSPPQNLECTTSAMGLSSRGRGLRKQEIGSVSTDALEIRTDDGAAVLRITPESHDVELVTTGKLSATAEGSVSLTCPTLQVMCPSTTFTGAVKIQGGLTFLVDPEQPRRLMDPSIPLAMSLPAEFRSSLMSIRGLRRHNGSSEVRVRKLDS